MITIKTEKDIALLREGGKRHSFILLELEKLVRSGISTEELNNTAVKLVEEKRDKAVFLKYRPHGVSRPYPAALCVSVNDEVVHGIPNKNPKILKEGDIVSLDLGISHKGLITDAAVTVPVGEIDGKAKSLLETTKTALCAGIKAAEGGNHVGDIGYAIEKSVKGSGFSIVNVLSGHGVGYSVHEDPFVPNTGNKGEGPLLKPGMVIAIEPIINEGGPDIIFDKKDGYTTRTADGKRSAHFEHTVLITEGKAEVLTI
jgi:methionyl aminopeptidase